MRKTTHDEYVSRVSKINPNIKVLGKYVGTKTKILHECKIDNHKWMTAPCNILCGCGCPVCSGNVIGDGPEYKNSIWSSEYREYFSKYMNENQMKTHMPNTHKKIRISCPDCGSHKNISPNTLLTSGLGCMCKGGRSYPNKFMYSLLNQLHIEFIPEKSFCWSDRRVYDIYIPSLQCIIENHGIQHYSESFQNVSNRSLKEERENDFYKEKIALENGIENYIVIDCRYSDIDWIKAAILSSSLPSLLNFNESDIDWSCCDKFASSSIIKTACDLWNDGLLIKEISDKLNINRNTIVAYLKKGANLGLCDYSLEKSRKRADKDRNKNRRNKVIRLSDCIVYDSIVEAANKNNMGRDTMRYKCRDKNGFMYYDDYVKCTV